MSGKKRKKITFFSVLLTIIETILLACVAAILIYVYYVRISQARHPAADAVQRGTDSSYSISESIPAPEFSAEPAVLSTPEPTPEPTPAPTPEPQPEYFTLSFIGDNTLKALKNFEYSEYGLDMKVGDDYAYPYCNTVDYFSNDEFTLANLECSFSEDSLAYDYTATTFPFLAKPAYVNILLEGGVDFVTMANNHTMDFFITGVEHTQAVLDEAGLPYGYENDGKIITTPNGLKLGIWTAGNDLLPNKDKAVAGVQQLRADGADIVICMFHWGQELYYTPNVNQTILAHACIDAGADIVYGSHPHCLQPVEVYNGKLIMYSLGNWVFGGSTSPSDCDTAIIQVTIKRDVDGSISYDGFDLIPCCVSSDIDAANAKAASYNDYCPTPYEEGTEAYDRAMSKLKGTYEALSQGADYSAYYASWG